MLIRINSYGDTPTPASEITPRAVFESRREFIRQLAVGSIAGGTLLEMASREAFAQSGAAQKTGLRHESGLCADGEKKQRKENI